MAEHHEESPGIRHALWALGGRLTNVAGNIIATAILSRVLLPDDFRRFIIARTGIGLVAIFAAFGLGNVALRVLGRSRSRDHISFTIQLALRASVLPLLTTTLCAVSGWWVLGDRLFGVPVTWQLACILSAASLILGLIQLLGDFARGASDLRTANTLGNLHGSPLLNLIMVPGFWMSAYVFALSWESAVLVFLILSVATLAAGGGPFCSRILRATANSEATASAASLTVLQMLSMAWPVVATSVLVYTSSQCDVFFAGFIGDNASATGYVAARRVSILLAIPATITYAAASGVISPLYHEGKYSQLQNFLRNGTTLVCIPAVVAGAVIMAFPEWTLRLILGDGYSHAATPLRLLIPGQLFICFTGNSGLLMSLTGHERKSMVANLVSTILLMVLSPLVAAHFGGTGLSIQTTLLVSGKSILVTEWARRVTGINTWVNPTTAVLGDLIRQITRKRKHFSARK